MNAITPRPLATLHIGADHSTVTVRAEGRPVRRISLALGARRIAAEHFRHQPPTPLEMENAIAAVEDELMRARLQIDPDATWQTSDADMGTWAALAGVAQAAPRVLSLEAVERQFDLLAALVQGRPASSAGIPGDAGLAATLLILRECMHHLPFGAITIETGLPPDSAMPTSAPKAGRQTPTDPVAGTRRTALY